MGDRDHGLLITTSSTVLSVSITPCPAITLVAIGVGGRGGGGGGGSGYVEWTSLDNSGVSVLQVTVGAGQLGE